MISCEQAQHLFDSYLNDELSASLVAEVDAHRLECAACGHQLALMEACGNVIRLDACEPRPSADFTDRLMAILDEEKTSRRWLGISRGMKVAGGLLGVAAAIAAVVVFYPTAVQDDQVAGTEISPDMIKSIPAATMISGLPLGLFFDATDNISSSIDLGHYSIDHLRTTIDPEDMPSPYPDFDLLPAPGKPAPGKPAPGKPELDIIELLPDLDDGGELL